MQFISVNAEKHHLKPDTWKPDMWNLATGTQHLEPETWQVLPNTWHLESGTQNLHFEPVEIAPAFTTSKKKSSKETLKTLKKKTFFQTYKIDWDTLFFDCKQDLYLSYKTFLDKITKLLDIHVPAKRLSHKEKKNLSKLWLTKDVLQFIKQKNVIYRKFIRTKDFN